MNGKAIRRMSLAEASNRKAEADWSRLDRMTDADIDRTVVDDPELGQVIDTAWLEAAEMEEPSNKLPITIRLDADVVEWFKAQGGRYQTRINAVLRSYVAAQRAKG